MRFFILIVDSDIGGLEQSDDYTIIPVTDLPIEGFLNVAFKFDIVELNTNVKPTFLAYLLDTFALGKIIYFDPDIYIYAPLDEVYGLLEKHDIVVTPHSLSPINDDKTPSEIDFLKGGIFNLGFVAVANRSEGRSFLGWWENRCLSLGFDEVKDGLFVDQKWVNLAPCFFSTLHILRHPGCNMAYWNLHERVLDSRDGSYRVNGKYPLVFFHFSGINPADAGQISKYQDRFELPGRPDLHELFDAYRQCVRDCGFDTYSKLAYGFGTFTDGSRITTLARRLFSEYETKLAGENPFDAGGSFYQWLRLKNLHPKHIQGGDAPAVKTVSKTGFKFDVLNKMMFLMHKLVGTDNYLLLLRYASYISRLRNQKNIFKHS